MLVVLSLFSSICPHPIHSYSCPPVPTSYSSMPHDGLPAYGTTAFGLVQDHRGSLPIRCQLRNHHKLFQPTSVERPPYLDGDLYEGIDKKRRARPRIIWKPIERKRAKRVGHRPLQLDSNSLSLSAGERFFFANLVRPIGSSTAETSTDPSSISVTIHRPPSIETKKQCDCVV